MYTVELAVFVAFVIFTLRGAKEAPIAERDNRNLISSQGHPI